MFISIFCFILAMMFSLESSSQVKKEVSSMVEGMFIERESWRKEKVIWEDILRKGEECLIGKWVVMKCEKVSLREEVIEEVDLMKDCLDLEERESWVKEERRWLKREKRSERKDGGIGEEESEVKCCLSWRRMDCIVGRIEEKDREDGDNGEESFGDNIFERGVY